MTEPNSPLVAALQEGDPETVASLIAAGADVRYRREHGYDALIDAVHGRDVLGDRRLLELLRMLIEHGVELSGVTSYEESGLRVLSRLGRFDAVRLLLDAGADERHLAWTPLIRAVALGSKADVEAAVGNGEALEGRDFWSRTAWLAALVVGDLTKAKLLRERGANVDARGRIGKLPLVYAIEGHHAELVRWLLEIGQRAEATDEFDTTPLMAAAEADDLVCVELLLAAGANPNYRCASGTVLDHASTREVVARLLAADADPSHLRHAGHRVLVGLPPDSDPSSLRASAEEFRRARTRRFGNSNPERFEEPFWESMIVSGISAHAAASYFSEASDRRAPVWCAERFGQSITFLADGRIVQIAGEHEDSYDADFCIYNDVFVHHPDGSIAIYGYPESDFPPTDFHTATLAGGFIYLVGSLGYQGKRRFGETPVQRLDVRTFRIETLRATGDAPGWLYGHRARFIGPHEILVSGGTLASLQDDDETRADNADTFVLDLERLVWRREPVPQA
jgi:ankyrin repeat protein